MNIYEAVSSGRPFRRRGISGYFHQDGSAGIFLRPDDLLALDWEIQNKKFIITDAIFQEAYRRAYGHTVSHVKECKLLEELKKLSLESELSYGFDKL